MGNGAGDLTPHGVRLSVIVATVDPWPAVQTCLDSLAPQACDRSIEIIVADGNGRGLPADGAPPGVRWLIAEGSSVFRSRAIGLAASRGDIVAFTEDHCRVAPDWCRRSIELHDLYPDAGGIGGAIENGAAGSTLDWLHFLIAHGPFMRPNRQGAGLEITGQANVSYKRKLLPSQIPDTGIHQMELNRELRRRGVELRMDDRLVVWHIQSLGLRGTCRIHFHTGRCIAGFRLPQLSAFRRLLRIGSCALLPAHLILRTSITAFRKKCCRRKIFIGLPLLAVFAFCHTLGELAGYLSGPGNSPQMAR